jgi:hypothetical protein
MDMEFLWVSYTYNSRINNDYLLKHHLTINTLIVEACIFYKE